jgi:hypothetical protein
MKATVAAMLATMVLAGCVSPAPTLPPTPPTFAASVDTPDGRVGVTLANSTLGLYSVGPGGEITLITTKQGAAPGATVHLSSYGGQTGLAYNTFVFGLAPAGATRFEIVPAGQALGGEVVEGVFLVALRAKDVTPQQLNWEFISEDGSVIERGSGIRD